MAGASHYHVGACDARAHGIRQDIPASEDGATKECHHICLRDAVSLVERLGSEGGHVPHAQEAREDVDVACDLLQLLLGCHALLPSGRPCHFRLNDYLSRAVACRAPGDICSHVLYVGWVTLDWIREASKGLRDHCYVCTPLYVANVL